MLHMLNLDDPRLPIQQHRPLGIPRQDRIEKGPGLLEPKPRVSCGRDPEDVTELFEAQAFGFGHDAYESR